MRLLETLVRFVLVLLLTTVCAFAQSEPAATISTSHDDGMVRGSFALLGDLSVNDPDADVTTIRSIIELTASRSVKIEDLEVSLRGTLFIRAFADNREADKWKYGFEQAELSIESRAELNSGWRVDPFVQVNLHSPLLQSHRVAKVIVQTSDLLDPIEGQEIFGTAIEYAGQSSTGTSEVGLSMKQFSATDYTRLTDDPKTNGRIETYRATSGFRFSSSIEFLIDSLVTVVGNLKLFSSFDHLETWDMRSEWEFKFLLVDNVEGRWRFRVVHNVLESLRTRLYSSMMLGVVAEL